MVRFCASCMQACYCGTECQKAAWRGHKETKFLSVSLKETCSPLQDILGKVEAAVSTKDWRAALKWEGRMEEMMANTPDAEQARCLNFFVKAHNLATLEFWDVDATYCTFHALECSRLQGRRVELLGKMELFRDQGSAIFSIGNLLHMFGLRQESKSYFLKTRKVAEAHGFFSLECKACIGLSEIAIDEGDTEEAVLLLQNALLVCQLHLSEEEEDTCYELSILDKLTNAFWKTDAIDELGKTILLYREAAKAETRRTGKLSFFELYSLVASARFHEVLCILNPWEVLVHTARALHATEANGIGHRCHHTREPPPPEHSALCRDVESLKRPRASGAL